MEANIFNKKEKELTQEDYEAACVFISSLKDLKQLQILVDIMFSHSLDAAMDYYTRNILTETDEAKFNLINDEETNN